MLKVCIDVQIVAIAKKRKDGNYYCNDLDCRVDPYDAPVCSEEYYNS